MRNRGRLASAAAALFLAVCLPNLAAAQTPIQAVRLDARAGFDGLVREGTSLPLIVLVESDRFVSGKLQVAVQGFSAPIVIERALDLPAGSRKELQMVIPRPSGLAVRFVDKKGTLLANRSPAITSIRNEELIGVFSSAPPSVTRVAIPLMGREARVVPVTIGIIDLGPDALRPLSHIVVDGQSTAALSPRQKDALLQYTAAGGELVVAAASEAALAFLPEPWRGSGRGEVRSSSAGTGRVTVALEALSGAGWAQGGAMWSRTIRAADLRRWRGDGTGSEWLEAITGGGGFRRAALGWLLVFVLGYVAIIGPVNFIVLGRLRRRELAWITVPVVSLLFASGAYVAGRGARNVPILQGAAVVVADSSSQQESFGLAILSRSGGRERLGFEGSWLVEPIPFEGGLAIDQPVVRSSRDRTEVDFRLAVGSVGTVSARRIRLGGLADAGSLAATEASYAGTVRNPFPVRLRRAGVYVGPGYAPIGIMEPRAESTVSVPDQGLGVGLEQPFFGNGDPSGFDQEIQAIFPLLRRAGLSSGVGEAGRAFLVGFADLEDVGPSLGIGRPPGIVLMAAPLRLTAAAGARMSPAAIRRSIVSADGIIEPNVPFDQVLDARNVVVRLELPAGRSASAITLSTQNFANFGGGFFGKPIPVPQPGFPGAEPVPLRPDAVGRPGFAGAGSTLSIYDFVARSWRALDASGGNVELVNPAEVRRHVSPAGELLVRFTSEFPQIFPVGALEMRAVLA